MNKEITVSKWIERLFPDTPCVLAAPRILNRRLKSVERLAALAAQPPKEDPEYIHQLRVAARRAEAALDLLRRFFPEDRVQRTRRMVRRVRRAASAAREADVHAAMLADEALRTLPGGREALSGAMERVRADRETAQKKVRASADGFGGRRARRKLTRSLRISSRPGRASGAAGEDKRKRPYTLRDLADAALPPVMERFRKSWKPEPNGVEDLHALRVSCKKLRYVLEILACCMPPGFKDGVYKRVAELQDRLGQINDECQLAGRLDTMVRDLNGGGPSDQSQSNSMVLLRDFQRRRLRQAIRAHVRWCDAARRQQLLDELADLTEAHTLVSLAWDVARENQPPDTIPQAANTAAPSASGNGAYRHRRVAAIDVGTNSIRLAVAETDPATGFRVIDDIKETTRLGTGVYSDGKLKVKAVKKSVSTLERMRAIAESYHVDRLRAVATSAVREASNGRDFVRLVRRRTRLPIEVIEPQREARLAFASVAKDFDLTDRRVAVVDAGGGSTELVFSSCGVIDAIRPLALGAVRLTEAFEHSEEPGRYHFQRMCRRIDKVLLKSIHKPPFRPEFIVGTGGTFTSLARVAIRHGEAGSSGRFPFAVRGYELRHKNVSTLLDWLRHLPLEERRRVPGLSTQRAEIIVAGLCIVDRLMKHLRVDRLVVHDGGIRDGLLAEIVDELGFTPRPLVNHSQQVLRAAHRLAERVRFDRNHSEHVARLALQVFDSLSAQDPDSAGTWARRELLEAAAILHEIGLRIAVRKHHKHSYDMIVNADLPELTRREIEIIANTCRYHRRSGPRRRHRGFRRLSAHDQRLVAHLAAILRIADGLDVTRRQNVSDVIVTVGQEETLFQPVAMDDVTANVRQAQRKSDVFESVFHTRARFSFPAPLLTGSTKSVPSAGVR